MAFNFETVPDAEVTPALRVATAPSTVLVRTADEQLTTMTSRFLGFWVRHDFGAGPRYVIGKEAMDLLLFDEVDRGNLPMADGDPEVPFYALDDDPVVHQQQGCRQTLVPQAYPKHHQRDYQVVSWLSEQPIPRAGSRRPSKSATNGTQIDGIRVLHRGGLATPSHLRCPLKSPAGSSSDGSASDAAGPSSPVTSRTAAGLTGAAGTTLTMLTEHPVDRPRPHLLMTPTSCLGSSERCLDYRELPSDLGGITGARTNTAARG